MQEEGLTDAGGSGKQGLGIDRSKPLFCSHMKALLRKRLLTFKRDKKMWAFVVFMPALFVLLGVIILLSVSTTDEPSLVLTPTVGSRGQRRRGHMQYIGAEVIAEKMA